MKTYLFQHSLTAVLPTKGHLKRLLACVFTSGISLALLANTASNNISLSDTVRSGADQNPILSIGSQISGTSGNDEFSLPLVMTAFKAILSDNKVMLSWTTGLEKRLSHFVIERSTDGTDFKEAAIIFAVTNSSAKQNYSFSEYVNVHVKGVLYYRIKIVDPSGKFQNSAVKIIRAGDESIFPEVSAYPNPVVNEVRITIPSSWQNHQVMYELYSSNGRLIKKMVNNNANQTETLNMQDLATGLYLVKTSTATESKSQGIFKK